MAESRPAPSDRSAGIEALVSVDELIAGLQAPDALPQEAAAGSDRGDVEVLQTHISVVFLAGRRVYKVKKPLRLWGGMLDYGDVATRKHWCEEEVRLNRRLAPEVYLGVAPVVRRNGRLRIVSASGEPPAADDEVVEHAVEMVRLPAGAYLIERLAAGASIQEELEQVGKTLAAFHAAQRLPPGAVRWAQPLRFLGVLRRNFRATRADAPGLFPASVHEGVYDRLRRRVFRARALMRRRIAEGRIVDGHGDVRTEHVIRHKGRAAILDCLEFSERLRHIDPLADAVFLSMDLQARGRPDLARAFEGAYLEHGGDPDAAVLLPLYRAYRAHVRAKVDAQTSRDADVEATVRARNVLTAQRYLALAWTASRAGAVPPLIVLRGPSGTGKSVLAGALAPWLGADVISSDVVRKELLGMAPTDRPEGDEKERTYSSDMSARTYAALLAGARTALLSGRAALLDATYLRRDSRAEARALAHALGAPFAILDVTCDPEEIRRRLIARSARDDDASDADWAVYQEQVRSAEPLTSEEQAWATGFESGDSPEAAVLPLIAVLDAGLDARREPLGPAPSAVTGA